MTGAFKSQNTAVESDHEDFARAVFPKAGDPFTRIHEQCLLRIDSVWIDRPDLAAFEIAEDILTP